MTIPVQQTNNNAQEIVVGVDTHKDFHVAAVLSAAGVLLGTRSFPATADGYRNLVSWVNGFGVLRRAGVEGTGAYGAGLTRVLHAASVTVVEVNRPDRATRRRRGKTDAVDAEAAARAVLGGSATAAAKTANGPVEGIRVLKLAKDSAVKARVQAMNQLHAVLVNADPALRERLAPLTPARLLRACAQLDPSCWAGVDAAVAYTLACLARRVRSLDAEVRELDRLTSATPCFLPHGQAWGG
ncbi:MAG TPA: transposase [Micromonosporaceae bacterium]|nr:transposase [Micromonosporaceae bacterium]